MTTECGEYEKMIEIPLASCEYVHKRKPRTLKKSKFIKRFNALLKRETKSDNVSAQASSEIIVRGLRFLRLRRTRFKRRRKIGRKNCRKIALQKRKSRRKSPQKGGEERSY